MSILSKKIFLAICIIIPFVLYCVYYYGHMVKNAPFRFSDFQSLEFSYGSIGHMDNRLNSATGEFQYLNSHDSVIQGKLRLRKDDLLYVHRKAMEYGFWNFPDDMTSIGTDIDSAKSVRFFLKLNYEEKSKEVLFDSQYDGDPRLKDAAVAMIQEMRRVLSDAEDKMQKK